MILFLILLILLSAFLSGSETSLFSLSQMTLKSYQSGGNARQKLVSSLMSRPRDILVTILMLNILVNILVQNTVAGVWSEGSWVFKVGLPLVLVLVFGEVLPKSIALPKNTYFAPFIAPVINWASRFLRPIREPLTKITNAFSRLFFVFLRKEETISVDELRHVLHASEEIGILLPQECDLIEGSLDLQQSIVKEHMRPRDEIVYFDIQDPLSHLMHLFVDLETTRVPVCNGNLEALLGVMSTRRYFVHREQIKTSEDLRQVLKKPYFVPESMKAWACLNNLRECGESLAVVIDEYGSISGLISQEDLIETVVGEIADRRDPSNLFTRSSEDVIIASGKLELAEFKDIFGIALKSRENVVTLGGWLIEQMGDIPVAGAQYATDQFLFYVLAAEPNRVRRIYVRCLKPQKKKKGPSHA